MAHPCKCLYCGETFNRDKFKDYVQINSRRYAHTACYNKHLAEVDQVEKDKQELEDYIKQLLQISSLDARIRKQIKQYTEEYHYTYTGIRKALTYFYEVRGNDVKKANGGIGIVPYIYQQAYNYYYLIWESNQRNEVKIIEQVVPQERVIVIPVPKRIIKTPKKFLFLEEDDG